MNQSKLKADARSWREARENVYEGVTIGFCLLLIGWKSCAGFLNQSFSIAVQNQLIFDTQVKTALKAVCGHSNHESY